MHCSDWLVGLPTIQLSAEVFFLSWFGYDTPHNQSLMEEFQTQILS